MKNQRFRLGLVVEGNTTGSAILRLEKLGEDLGPVKSVGLGAARRLSNALRAGTAVADYEGLRDASVIMLQVPEASVGRVIAELADTAFSFEDVSFVLCENWMGLERLEPLRQKGCQIASLITLPVVGRDWFVLEGNPKPIRAVKRIVERSGRKVTELAPGGTCLLYAAQLLVAVVPTASLQAAQQGLRAAGFAGKVLNSAMEQMIQKTTRDFSRGSKVRWGGPLREFTEELTRTQLTELAKFRPDLASFINAQMAAVNRLNADV